MDVAPEADHARVRLADADLVVRPVAVGHGRPQEVRDALARLQRDARPRAAGVLVAERFTAGAVAILERTGANFLDDRRFVFRHSAPFVAIDRERRPGPALKHRKEPRLTGRIGMAVQAMLLDDLEWWGVNKLAEATAVAPGTAQAALRRLEEVGLVDVTGRGPSKRRRLRDKGAVLDLWAQQARAERRRLLAAFVLGQGPVDVARQVAHRLTEARLRHAVTGASAALLVAPHVTDVRTCEVWVDPLTSASLIVGALDTAPVERGGNVVVLQSGADAPLFAASQVEGVVVANPLRVYADLLEDPRRGEEQATFLRETVLGY